MKPTNQGDNYQLWHGDCLEVMAQLEPQFVDAVITDPPYGLGKLWRGGTWFQRGVYSGSVSWDRGAPQKAVEFILSKFSEKVLVVWGGNYFSVPPSRCWDIWRKTNNVPTMADFEMCWTNQDKTAKEFNHPCNGWVRSHPTEKPVSLMEWQILRHTTEGQIVLDPFMGSGSTGVAAMRTGRKFIGIELEREYYDISLERVANAAGDYRPSIKDNENQLSLLWDVGKQ